MDIVHVIAENEARVNVTFAACNGDLPDPVMFDASDEEIRRFVTEALRNGNIHGISAHPNPDLHGYKIDRFEPTENRPYRLLQVRPATEFG